MLQIKNKIQLSKVLVVFTFLLGAFFLLYKFPSIPFGLNHDAAWNGLAAIRLLKTPYYVPYFAEAWAGETLFHYWLALNFHLFEIHPVVLRGASICIGLLTLTVFYFLAKNLFNDKIGLISLFFLATSGWHLTMSKTGWRAILVPLFQTLTFLFLWKGLVSKKILPFILCGIFLALTLNTYDAARATLIITPLFFIYLALIQTKFFQTYRRQLTALSLAFLIVIVPLANYALSHWQAFTGRANFLFVGKKIEEAGNLKPLWDNIKTAILTFHVRANGNDFFVNEPLLDPLPGILFVVGLLSSLFKLRQKNYFLITLWFFAALIPGILSIPNGNRNIGTLAPVYLFTGIGGYQLFSLSTKIFKKRINVIRTIIVISITWQTFLTFNQYLGPNRREIWGFYPETTIVGNFIQTVKKDFEVYITDNYPRDALTFLTYETGRDPFLQEYHWFENAESFFQVEKLGTKGLIFIMFDQPTNKNILNRLQEKFPSGKLLQRQYKNDKIDRCAALVFKVEK